MQPCVYLFSENRLSHHYQTIWQEKEILSTGAIRLKRSHMSGQSVLKRLGCRGGGAAGGGGAIRLDCHCGRRRVALLGHTKAVGRGTGAVNHGGHWWCLVVAVA